jgi:hypothetical protein
VNMTSADGTPMARLWTTDSVSLLTVHPGRERGAADLGDNVGRSTETAAAFANAYGRTSRRTVSLALAPDGSVHVALKLTSTPPPAAFACPAPMEQPSAPPAARNWLMAPCMACSNAGNWLTGNIPTGVQGRLIVPETQIVTL